MKRWEWILPALLLCSAIFAAFSSSVYADIVTNSTQGGSSYTFEFDPVVKTGESSEVTFTYYFTTQLIKKVTTRLYYNEVLKAEEEMVPKQEGGDVLINRIEVLENADSISSVKFEVVEVDMDDKEFVTRKSFPVVFGSTEAESASYNHDLLIYQESPKIITRELSIFEPLRTRGSFEYSVRSTNRNKVDCQLVDKSLVAFVASDTFSGRSSCTIDGTYGNITLSHRFNVEVRPSRKTVVTDLPELVVDDLELPYIISNFTGFCTYDASGLGMEPFMGIKNPADDFLHLEGQDLVIDDLPAVFGDVYLVPFLCDEDEKNLVLKRLSYMDSAGLSLSVKHGDQVIEADLDSIKVSLQRPESVMLGQPIEILVDVAGVEEGLTPVNVEFVKDGLSDELDCNGECSLSRFIPAGEVGVYSFDVVFHFSIAKNVESTSEEGYDFTVSDGEASLKVPVEVEVFDANESSLKFQDVGILTASDCDVEFLSDVAEELGLDYSGEELKADLIETSKYVSAEKALREVETFDNQGLPLRETEVTLRLSLLDSSQNPWMVRVIEFVPKHVAQTIGNLRFPGDPAFEIIDSDPVFAYDVPVIDGLYQFKYVVGKPTEHQGLTLVLASDIKSDSGFSWLGFVIVVAVVLLFAGLLVLAFMIAKRIPRKERITVQEKDREFRVEVEQSKPHVMTAAEKLAALQSYVKNSRDTGVSDSVIRVQLINRGWPHELVEKLLEIEKKENFGNII
ncbi:hypothetical protein JW868_03435 [Candidatus Woesearchaeota archaeon]|nr:hypothetical protein [Candidatus Woesearchaeota archaeon]